MKFKDRILSSPFYTFLAILVIFIMFLSAIFPDDAVIVIRIATFNDTEEVYSDTLRIFTFTEYFDHGNTIKNFEEKNKVKVIKQTYTTNEQLIDSLDAGVSYDLIVPSDYTVTKLSKEGKIQLIQRELITNYDLIDLRLREMEYDVGNMYSIPYFWGAIGLMYDTRHVTNPPLSWSAIFDTTEIVRMRYSISMLDDPRMTLGISLISLGYDPNTTNEQEIAEATNQLIQLAPYLNALQSDGLEEQFKSENINLAVNWSGNSAYVANRNSNVRFSMPAEGSIFFVDNLSIPANAKNPDIAHEFINYLLDPKIAAELTNSNFYPNPITESRRYVDRIIIKGPSYINPFLSTNISSNKDLGNSDTLYTLNWRRFITEYNRVDLSEKRMQSMNDRMILY